MPDQSQSFEEARGRLEEIAAEVRRKDVSLEKSLDLLEEGVLLANACTEMIDHTQWRGFETSLESAAEEAVDASGGPHASEADAFGTGDSGADIALTTANAAEDPLGAEIDVARTHTADAVADGGADARPTA